MQKYIIKRVILFIPTLFLASVFIFVMMRMVPGDIAAAILGDDATPEAVAKLHNELGLNRPLVIQYVSWLWDLVRLDLGSSLLYRGIEVGTLIREAIPITITMTIYGMIITIIIAVPVGVVTGLREDLKTGGNKLSILLNRLLFDRSFL